MVSGDETTDVGTDSATPVTDDYSAEDTRFAGRVSWVQIDVRDDADHCHAAASPTTTLLRNGVAGRARRLTGLRGQPRATALVMSV